MLADPRRQGHGLRANGSVVDRGLDDLIAGKTITRFGGPWLGPDALVRYSFRFEGGSGVLFVPRPILELQDTGGMFQPKSLRIEFVYQDRPPLITAMASRVRELGDGSKVRREFQEAFVGQTISAIQMNLETKEGFVGVAMGFASGDRVLLIPRPPSMIEAEITGARARIEFMFFKKDARNGAPMLWSPGDEQRA